VEVMQIRDKNCSCFVIDLVGGQSINPSYTSLTNFGGAKEIIKNQNQPRIGHPNFLDCVFYTCIYPTLVMNNHAFHTKNRKKQSKDPRNPQKCQAVRSLQSQSLVVVQDMARDFDFVPYPIHTKHQN
jgi:hypothetical protein